MNTPLMRRSILSLLTLIVVASAPLLATAQQTNTPDGINAEQEWPDLYGPGTIDAQMTLGVGSLLSPRIEPAIDFGLLPLGDELTLSVGASVALSYCVGCLIFDVISTIEVRAWTIDPLARVLVHVESLTRALRIKELDVYGGIVAGPSLFNFTITDTNNQLSAVQRVFAVGGGALGGMHYMVSDRVYLGAELRYLLYFGINTGSVTIDGKTYSEFDSQNYIEGGMNYTFHLGARF